LEGKTFVENGSIRRRPKDHEELKGLLNDAEGSVHRGDLQGTNEALKRAGVKAATMWGGVGRASMPQPVRDLDYLTWEVQTNIQNPSPPVETMLQTLRGLRSRFDDEARLDDGDAT
jgi:hypothetical protein